MAITTTVPSAPIIDSKAPSSPSPQAQTPPISQPDAQEGQSVATPDPRLAQLAKQEKALRRQSQEFKAQKAAWEAEKAKAPTTQAFDKKTFLADPLSYGLTPDELSQGVLGALNQDPAALRIKQLEARIEQLSTGLEATKQEAVTNQQKAYEEAKRQISAEAKALVEKNDAYEAIRAEGAHEAITALVERTYKEEGVLMSVEEAAQQVEEYLVDKAMSYTKLKKIQEKLSPPAPVAAPAAEAKRKANPPTVSPRQQTLTQTLTTQSKPLTSRERRERAILAYQGKLS